MTVYGPWRPYVQTVTYGSGSTFGDALIEDTRGAMSLSTYFDGGGYVGALHLDSLMRQCALAHLQLGSSVAFYAWAGGTCPTIVPDLPDLTTGTFPGMYTDFATVLPFFRLTAIIGNFTIAAQTTPSHGMPSWQDPANAYPPPSSAVVDGTLELYEYEPFSSIEADLTFPAGMDASGSMVGVTPLVPVDIRIRQMPLASPFAWSPGDGVQVATVSVDTAGFMTPTGPILGVDLVSGFQANVVPSFLEAGHFPLNDPGYLTNGGAFPYPALTVRRHGRRRKTPDRIELAPPLHQRQRGDGITGADRSARGLNSRQRGLFQRGIF